MRNELSIARQNMFCGSMGKVYYRSTIRFLFKADRALVMLGVRDILVKTEKMEMTYTQIDELRMEDFNISCEKKVGRKKFRFELVPLLISYN